MCQDCGAKDSTSHKTRNGRGTLTWIVATTVGRWRMAGLELVLATQIQCRGVKLVSRTPSPIRNYPCFLPCPAIITAC
jgi:hypothetical protein